MEQRGRSKKKRKEYEELERRQYKGKRLEVNGRR